MSSWLDICPQINMQVLESSLIPTRSHEGDAGLDCRSASLSKLIIPPGASQTVDLGFKIEIPYGFMGLLVSRSGMGKLQVSLANSVGIIDHQYRGWVMARLENRGVDRFIVEYLDRIAQLVIVPVALPSVNLVDKVFDTVRGDKGFGSTGIQ